MGTFSFVLPSFMILLILLVYYFSRPRLPIRLNRTFLRLLALENFVILFELLKGMTADTAPQGLTLFLNLMFYVLFTARIFWFFLFTVDLLQIEFRPKSARIVIGAVFFIAEAAVLASPFTGSIFYVDAAGYHNGPEINLLNGCFLFYILLSVLLGMLFSDQLEPNQLHSVLGYNAVLLIGVISHYIYDEYLLMNTFSLMALIIIYLTFLNPDFFTSDRGPAFNLRAFRFMLDEVNGTKNFRLLAFVLRNYTDEREIYGYHQMDMGITEINRFLKTICPNEQLFYLRNGCFAILGESSMDWDGIQRGIYERFQKPWSAEETDMFLNAAFVRISSASEHTDPEIIINRLLSAFNESRKKITGEETLIDLDEIHDVDRQVDVKRSLEKAIESDAVEIFLQPLIECRTSSMIGAEVLARIRDDKGRLISPASFIPIAEQNGQINRMGAQVFEKACRFIQEGNLKKTGLKWLNVNLSPIQCMKKDLAEQFGSILNKYDVKPSDIHLEITEAAMIDLSLLEKQIRTLRENGFMFSLDDYGSGYSNLTRVKHYPFINIKLDMDVVWDYYEERDELLPAIIQAFKRLHFSVTAEGIETKEMGEALSEIGCDYLQGFYYSRPLPVDEFLEKYALKHSPKQEPDQEPA